MKLTTLLYLNHCNRLATQLKKCISWLSSFILSLRYSITFTNNILQKINPDKILYKFVNVNNFTDFADEIMYHSMRLKENEDYLIDLKTMKEYRQGVELLNTQKNGNRLLCAVLATVIVLFLSMFCVLDLFDEQSHILILFPIMFVVVFSVVSAFVFLNFFWWS